jgi:polysaccharide biosynthesis/export protein
MRHRRLFAGVLLLILGSVIALCGQDQKTSAPGKPDSAGSDYVIGLQDVLSVLVWKEPELSVKDVVVRSDGKVSLPLINDVQAKGLTTTQLQQVIAEKLKEFVAAPTVSVTVVKSLSQSVSVMGQVGKPGVYYLGAPLTVLELLARAGGLGEYAKSKKIKIVRSEGGRSASYLFNYKEVVEGKNLQQNITLKSGDIVIVP